MTLFYLQFLNDTIIGKTLLLVCFVFHVFLADARHLEIVRLRPMEKTQTQAENTKRLASSSP